MPMLKKTMMYIVITAGILFAVSGCRKESTSKDTEKMAEKHLQVLPIKERQASFEKKIEVLKNMGFDVNKTADNHYMVSVVDSKAASIAMLSLLDLATLDQRSRRFVEKAISGAKIGIEVDWKKYAADKAQSVLIYFAGNGRESKALTTLLSERKLAAYLTFDAKDVLQKAEMKAIEEKLPNGNDTISLSLKGAMIEVDTSRADSRYMVKGGTFNYQLESNGSKLFEMGYRDPVCKVDKKNAYLGTWHCILPLLTVHGYDKNDTISVAWKETIFDYATVRKDKKIKADMALMVPGIDIKTRTGKESVSVALKNLKISGVSDHIDEALLKEIYTLAGTPAKDHNVTFHKYMKLVGDLMGSGIAFQFKMALSELNGKAVSDANSTHFSLHGYQGEAKGVFDKTFSYQEKASIKEITVKAEKAASPLFALKGFKFGYAIKDLYNFFPAFMEFAAITAGKDPAKHTLSKTEQEKLSAIGMRIVHDGFGLSLAPVGVDSVHFTDKGKQHTYGQLNLAIDAKLLPNSVKLNNPMSAMLLLAFLQADGKLVLTKADLNSMSNSFPPQVMAMVMMYAKYEGDKAIFELKFEKGHLLVNDKPVM